MDNSIKNSVDFTHQMDFEADLDQKTNLRKSLVELSDRIKNLCHTSLEFKQYIENLNKNFVVENTTFETLVEIKPIFPKKNIPEIYQVKQMKTSQKVKSVLTWTIGAPIVVGIQAFAEGLPVIGMAVTIAAMSFPWGKSLYEQDKSIHDSSEIEKQQYSVNILKSKILLGESYIKIKEYVENDPVLSLHVCPISEELLFYPVVTSDFKSYNLESLNRYLTLEDKKITYRDSIFTNPETNQPFKMKYVASPFRSYLIATDLIFPDYPRLTVIKHRLNHILNNELKNEKNQEIINIFQAILSNINNQFEVAKKSCDDYLAKQRLNPTAKLSELKLFKKAYEFCFEEVVYYQSEMYGTPEEFDGTIEKEEKFVENLIDSNEAIPNDYILKLGFKLCSIISSTMMGQNVENTLTWKVCKNYIKKV